MATSRHSFIFVSLLCGLLSCGPKHKTKSSSDSDGLPELKAKAEFYLSQVGQFQDEHGFIFSDTCDALLFSGLLSAAAPQLHVNIAAAQDIEGAWHRRPGHDCGPTGGNSRSTISRDMILGLMWHMWRNQDLDMAEQFMRDLQANNYILKGEGTPGELAMTTLMLQTLANMIEKLGGTRHYAEQNLPVLVASGTGFEAHLIAWHIALRGEIHGGISDNELQVLAEMVTAQPRNPLLQAVYHKYLDGNYGVVLELLMDRDEWPEDRLPSSLNHCDAWPIQRDYADKDWGSCEPEVIHPGAELPVIYYLLISTSGAE